MICQTTLTTLIFTFLFLYYLETFILGCLYFYVLLLALLGFMGGILFGASPVPLKFFLNGSCFTLFIRVYFIYDDR